MLKTLSIDGAVISVVRDVLHKSASDSGLLVRFVDELNGAHADRTPAERAITALNAVYHTDIPEDGGTSLRSALNSMLELSVDETYRGVLTLGIDIDVGFLDMLARIGPDRIELLAPGRYALAKGSSQP